MSLVLALWMGWAAWAQDDWEEEAAFDALEDFEDDAFLVADEVAIFVSEFQSSSKEAAGLAGLMRDFLDGKVDEHPLLRTLSVYDAPDFGEHSALLYLQTCPMGEQVGCAYVVASQIKAAYALVGVVHEVEGDRKVDLSVVDVADGREAFSLQVDLALGGDERLADGVVRLLVSIAEGSAGQLEDIRHEDSDESAERVFDRDVVSSQLEELAQELGGVSTLNSRIDRTVKRPEYTVDDLGREGESDAAKPWEMLGMSSEEYLRYRNSGQTLHGWKQSQLGRKGQVILRPVVGPARGAFDTEYFGIYAIEEDPPFAVLDTYAWQGFRTGNGLSGGGWVGYGFLPSMELSVGGGVNFGRYSLYVRRQEGAVAPEERQPESQQQLNLWAGARLVSVRRFTTSIRPLAGVGILWRQGHAFTDYWASIPAGSGGSNMPEFTSPTVVELQLIPGVELAFTEMADLSVSLPFGFGVGGTPFQVYEEDAGIIARQEPEAGGGWSLALELGLALHLFGPEIEVDDLYLDDLEEPLD